MLANKVFSQDVNTVIKFISNLSHDVTENKLSFQFEIKALKNSGKNEKAHILEKRCAMFLEEAKKVEQVYEHNLEQGTKLHRLLISKYGYNEATSELNKELELDNFKDYFINNYSLFRKAVGLTRKQVGIELHVTETYIYSIERNNDEKFFSLYFLAVLKKSKSLGNFDMLILSHREKELFENIVLTNKNKYNVRESLTPQKVAMLEKEECVDYDGIKIPKFLMNVLFNS